MVEGWEPGGLVILFELVSHSLVTGTPGAMQTTNERNRFTISFNPVLGQTLPRGKRWSEMVVLPSHNEFS